MKADDGSSEPAEEDLTEAELDDALLEPVDGASDPAPGEQPAAELVLARGSGTVVRQDTLSRYLAEISRFERLGAEDEHAIAVRFRDHGDPADAGRLVAANLGLVVAVAMSFRRAVANVLDLIQEGNIGLMEAVQRFDPDKGTRLSTYATWWIRSRIIKYLLDNWRQVRVGTTNARRKLLYNLRAEKERLEARGISPTPKLLAARLGTSTEDVIAVDQALGSRDVSLDQPVTSVSTTPRHELLPSATAASPEESAAQSEFRERLHAVLARLGEELSPRERALLQERLLADDPVTLQALADREGVTCEAIRQSEKRLLRRLREHLREHLPEAADVEFFGG